FFSSRRRHTRSKRDWSSDVCSSDLAITFMPTLDAVTETRAPRGSSLRCKGWKQEAAMRMLMNNLDPEVAERPQDLVVYGGSGKRSEERRVGEEVGGGRGER